MTAPAIQAATLIDNPVFLDAEPVAEDAGQSTVSGNIEAKLKNYAIQPSDLLEIQVRQDSGLNTTVRVDANGDITFPLIGIVHVKDSTAEQLEQQIADLLGKDYIQNPQVTVMLREYKKPKISISGSVIAPGTYDLPGRTTLLESIALAGGPTENADLTKIRLTRKTPPSSAQPPLPTLHNAQSIIAAKQEDPELADGDSIHVEKAVPVIIEGAVIKPGPIYPNQALTLQQLIMMAGGPKPLADNTEIAVYWLDESGNTSEKIYNLEDIAAGKAEDPLIQPGHRIVINECAAKYKLFNQTICTKKK